LKFTRRGRDRGDAGVVDEHVDVAELAVDSVDETVQLVPVADVAGIGEGAAAQGADLRGHRLAGIELAARDGDVRPHGREALGHLVAEPAAPARDQYDLAGHVEILFHRLHPLLVKASHARCTC
jgi:hypothetical protein